jgi:exopolyphosphatase/guanosine-5'-triphosphate,3'-diphosphate pyrophosphatase
MSHNIAAIDIGSNAIRLVIAINEGPLSLRLVKKIREPVRLGHDVFLDGIISEKTMHKAVLAFEKFNVSLKKWGVARVRAIGTSALREAKNQNEFIEKIKFETGIQIRVIDGVEEAHLVHTAVKKEVDLSKGSSTLIDIGGGSVELTFTENGTPMASKSFPLGTVRLLEILTKKKQGEFELQTTINESLDSIKHFIQANNTSAKINFAVGTGGNLECLGRLRMQILKKTPKTFLTDIDLEQIIDQLSKYSVEERIKKLDLKEDRADVILPAALVLQTILKQLGTQKILIPFVGLRDGILWSMLDS